MKNQVYASPKYTVGFSVPIEALRALQKISENHYDGVCKSAGRKGGFLYGWVGFLEWTIDHNKNLKEGQTAMDMNIHGEFKDFDTSLKIMEQMEMLHTCKVINDDEYSNLFKLRSYFTRLCRKMNELYQTVEWEEEF